MSITWAVGVLVWGSRFPFNILFCSFLQCKSSLKFVGFSVREFCWGWSSSFAIYDQAYFKGFFTEVVTQFFLFLLCVICAVFYSFWFSWLRTLLYLGRTIFNVIFSCKYWTSVVSVYKKIFALVSGLFKGEQSFTRFLLYQRFFSKHQSPSFVLS